MGGTRSAFPPKKTVWFLQPLSDSAVVGCGRSSLGAWLPDFYHPDGRAGSRRRRHFERSQIAACASAPAVSGARGKTARIKNEDKGMRRRNESENSAERHSRHCGADRRRFGNRGRGYGPRAQPLFPASHSACRGDEARRFKILSTRSRENRGGAHPHDAAHETHERKRLDPPQNRSPVSENAGTFFQNAGHSCRDFSALLRRRGGTRRLRLEIHKDMTPMIRDSHSLQRPFLPVFFACLACALALLNAPPIHAQDSIVHFDKADAKIDFSLGSSLHTVHGTFSLKNSSIHFDPANGKISGFVAVDATSGESGNNSRDSRMHREIIESAKFPEIVFTPTQITGAVAPDGTSKVNISGRFSLHGKDHDVTFPVEVVAG